MATTYLSQGSKGEDVRLLQEQLKAAGYDPGPIDADFGPKTAAALGAYQTSKGLDVDSIAGPQTWGSLQGMTPATTVKPAQTPATADVLRQAAGLGIPESGVDPAYLSAVNTGDASSYTANAIRAGQAKAAGTSGSSGTADQLRQYYDLALGNAQKPTAFTAPQLPTYESYLQTLQQATQHPASYTAPQFNYQQAPVLSLEEARQQAAERLNPGYQQEMADRIKTAGQGYLQRGFYGQLPTVPLNQDIMARVEAARLGAVSTESQNAVAASRQQAAQEEAAALQRYTAETGFGLQAQEMTAQQKQQGIANLLQGMGLSADQAARQAQLTMQAQELTAGEKQRGMTSLADALNQARQQTGMEAELTGTYGGQSTQAAREAQLANDLRQAELAATTKYQQGQLGLSQAELDWLKKYQQGQLDIDRGKAATAPPKVVFDPKKTQDALRAIDGVIQSGMAPEDVAARIMERIAGWEAEGVDTSQIYKILNELQK